MNKREIMTESKQKDTLEKISEFCKTRNKDILLSLPNSVKQMFYQYASLHITAPLSVLVTSTLDPLIPNFIYTFGNIGKVKEMFNKIEQQTNLDNVGVVAVVNALNTESSKQIIISVDNGGDYNELNSEVKDINDHYITNLNVGDVVYSKS